MSKLQGTISQILIPSTIDKSHGYNFCSIRNTISDFKMHFHCNSALPVQTTSTEKQIMKQ